MENEDQNIKVRQILVELCKLIYPRRFLFHLNSPLSQAMPLHREAARALVTLYPISRKPADSPRNQFRRRPLRILGGPGAAPRHPDPARHVRARGMPPPPPQALGGWAGSDLQSCRGAAGRGLRGAVAAGAALPPPRTRSSFPSPAAAFGSCSRGGEAEAPAWRWRVAERRLPAMPA